MSLEMGHGGKPWGQCSIPSHSTCAPFFQLTSFRPSPLSHLSVADPNHWNYRAAATATESVYQQQPDLTREGGSIPVTLSFADALGVNVLLLPMGRADDGAHSINEKLDLSNYIKGTQLLGSYLHEVAALSE